MNSHRHLISAPNIARTLRMYNTEVAAYNNRLYSVRRYNTRYVANLMVWMNESTVISVGEIGVRLWKRDRWSFATIVLYGTAKSANRVNPTHTYSHTSTLHSPRIVVTVKNDATPCKVFVSYCSREICWRVTRVYLMNEIKSSWQLYKYVFVW